MESTRTDHGIHEDSTAVNVHADGIPRGDLENEGPEDCARRMCNRAMIPEW
jgi:hypothetical protein